MLRRLDIQHFKSIEKADVELGMVNIFVGNNGSGKSNIIDAIRFLRDASNNGLDRAVSDRHGIASIRQWSPTRPYRVRIGVEYEAANHKGSYALSIDSREGEFSVASEAIEDEHWEQYWEEEDEGGEPEPFSTFRRISLYRKKSGDVTYIKNSYRVPGHLTYEDLHEVAGVSNPNPEVRKLRIGQADELFFNAARNYYEFSEVRRIISNMQAYSIYPNTLRLPQEPSNETFLSPEGRNLGSVFKRMRKSKAGADGIGQITEAMRFILPGLDKISILSVGGYVVPQFHVVESNKKGHIFNVSQMSDGTLRMLGLLTALYQQPRPAIIALEEPEQTVNPGILTVLADAIKEVSKSAQIIVTTHSPNLLDHFDASHIRAVEMIRGKTNVGPISDYQMDIVRERLFSLGELLVNDGLHQ